MPSLSGRVLMDSVSTASRPTPGTFIRTRPDRVPASPPALPGEAPVMTSSPTPSERVIDVGGPVAERRGDVAQPHPDDRRRRR